MASKKVQKKRIQLCNTHQIVSSFYVERFTLLSYIRKVKKEICNKLIQNGDPTDYKLLLKSTLIAVPRDKLAAPPFKPSHTRWFTLKEITNRVIEHVCRSKKTNVLAFGFEPLSGHGRNGTVAGTVGIQNSYPNTIVSYLRTSKAWLLLHERIGDDLMIHLLQNVAVFVKATSKCYFQVAGFPVSRLTPLTDKDVPPADTKQRISSPSEAENAHGVKKMRRGGNRMRKSRENLVKQKEGEVLTALNTVTGINSNALDVAYIPDEVMKNASSSVPANPPDQPESRKRRASDNLNDVQEAPSIKRPRPPFNVEVSPVLFPVQAGEKSTNSPADSHTAACISIQNESVMAELSPVKDGENSKNVLADILTPVCSAPNNEIKMSSPKDDLTKRSDIEVSPLLFPEEGSEKSVDESTRFGSVSVLLPSKINSGSRELHDVVMSLFQGDTEIVVECVDGSQGGDDSCRSQQKDITTKPVEKIKMLKRKKCISGAGVKEKRAKKSMRPWKYLSRLLPQPGQIKSLAKKKPVPKDQDKSKSKKSNRKQLDKEKGQPTSKTSSQGVRLNDVYLPRSRLFYTSNLSQSLPKKHVMETTSVSMNGARKLVNCIFLEGNCLINSKKDVQSTKNVAGASSNQKQTSRKKEKPVRLSKRLKSVQPLLLKFLSRHRKCRFRILLKLHCFYTNRRTRVNKSGKKKGILRRRVFNFPKRRVWHKCPLKRSGLKVFKRPHRDKKARVDVLVYRHAVGNYTKHEQVKCASQ